MSAVTFVGRPIVLPPDIYHHLIKTARRNKDATGDESHKKGLLKAKSRPFSLPTDLPCPQCSRLDIRIFGLMMQSEIPVGKHTYHCLFHSVCRQRDRRKSSDTSTCGFCGHLDLFHVIYCFLPLVLEGPISVKDAPLGGMGQVAGEVELATDWYHEENLAADCGFCQFLAKVVGAQTNLDYIKLILRVRMFSDNDPSHVNMSLEFHVHYSDSGELRTKELLFRSINDSLWDPILPLSQEVDWKLVNSWLCKDTTKPQKLLPEFRVIDIERNCVFKPEDPVEYVTLSYVWGQRRGELEALEKNIQELEKEGSLSRPGIPATIQDAMSACRILGQRYLWVDRLCIVQHEGSEKMSELIRHMDAVYGSSTFTIVAASGDDARSGLAGVSRQREASTNVLRWQCFELSQPLPRLHQGIVAKSTWNTRGWTYQEAMCSKSCLYFTDYGVFFSDQTGRIKGELPSLADTPRPATGYFSAVEQYTKRFLSNPTDILRAFTGVLNHLVGDRHLYGLPLDMFTEAVLWEPIEPNCDAREKTSNEIFPSWSWASVEGRIHYDGIYASTYGKLAIMGLTGFGADHTIIQPVASWAFPSPSQDGQLAAMSFQDKQGMKPEGLSSLAWDEGMVDQKYFEWGQIEHIPIGLQHIGGPNPKFLQAFPLKHREDVMVKQGRVLVYTQSTKLKLELIPGSDGHRRAFLLRTANGAFAGAVRLTTLASQTFLLDENNCSNLEYEFLALALKAPFGEDTMRNVLGDIKLYLQDATEKGMELGARCCVHEDPKDKALQEEAWKEYEKELRYNDANEPARVEVMLIARRNEEIASRFGIGTVYLKKWIQSNPKFVTAILQ